MRESVDVVEADLAALELDDDVFKVKEGGRKGKKGGREGRGKRERGRERVGESAYITDSMT